MQTSQEVLADVRRREERINQLLQSVTPDLIETLQEEKRLLDRDMAALHLLKKGCPKDEAIGSAEALIERLFNRLALLTSDDVFRDNKKVLFQEAGQWARHYSTVRMTVATFTITSCTAIMALASKNDRLATSEDVAYPVTILWILGLCVFWLFTMFTHKELVHQRKSLPIFLMRSPKGKEGDVGFDKASVIIALLSLTATILAVIKKMPYPSSIALAVSALFGALFPFVYRRLAKLL
jgi:hypothetical protein